MVESNTFPLGEAIAEAELKERFVRLEDEPYGNAELAYSIALPSDWLKLGIEAQDATLHADKPKLLSSLLSPTDRDANAMLQVWCQGLIKEIAASDWLQHYLTSTQRNVGSLQSLSPYFADAVAHWQIDKVGYTMRVAARLAGNRMFFIQGMAPDDLYPDYADAFGLAISSFKVARETDNPHVEMWQTHTLDGQIACNAPLSWPERKPSAPSGMDAVDLFNLDAQGAPIGVLKLMTVRRALTAGKKGIDLPSLLVMEFAKIGVEVVDVASDDPLEVAPPFARGRLKILTARLPKGDARLRNLFVADVLSPAHHVLAGLLTCAPNEGFYEYAVNRRAFDIALGTLRVS